MSIIKKIFIIAVFISTFLVASPANAQMMGWGWAQGQNQASQSAIQSEVNEQNEGQQIYQNLQDKKITCNDLTSTDFEKLGEYFMGEMAGSAENHVYMDQRLQQMMGDSGDTQMHIILGERYSGCNTTAPIPTNAPSFITGMISGNYQNYPGGRYPYMGYGYGMTNGFYGWGGGNILLVILGIIALADLVLVGIYLIKKVRK